MKRLVIASLLILAAVAVVRFGTDFGREAGAFAEMVGWP